MSAANRENCVVPNPTGPFPAAFLDKDGTLMEDIPYNSDPQKFLFSPGVVEGLGLLSRAGFRLVIISNQSGVARGLFPREALGPMEDRLRQMFASEGLMLDGVYWCPHHPDGGDPEWGIDCQCRKPAPGMLQRAARDLNIDLAASWMIGDRDSDIGAARNSGCHGALLSGKTGPVNGMSPEILAPTFLDIALGIVAQTKNPSFRPMKKRAPNG